MSEFVKEVADATRFSMVNAAKKVVDSLPVDSTYTKGYYHGCKDMVEGMEHHNLSNIKVDTSLICKQGFTPVSWQFRFKNKWWNCDDRIEDNREITEQAGYETRNVYSDSVLATLELMVEEVAGLRQQNEALKTALKKLNDVYYRRDADLTRDEHGNFIANAKGKNHD